MKYLGSFLFKQILILIIHLRELILFSLLPLQGILRFFTMASKTSIIGNFCILLCLIVLIFISSLVTKLCSWLKNVALIERVLLVILKYVCSTLDKAICSLENLLNTLHTHDAHLSVEKSQISSQQCNKK